MPMRLAAIVLVCLLGAGAQAPAGDASAARVFAHPAYRAAVDVLDRTFPQFLDDIGSLTEIPAPTGEESARAAAMLARMRDAGLASAAIDAAGNVVARHRGAGGPLLAIVAHLDTVFPEGTDVRVRRNGTRWAAPGIGDNSVGLAVLLALARAITGSRAPLASDVLFIADVGEEATGDLRGIKYVMTQGPLRGTIAQVIAIDGAGDGRIVTTAGVGSRRYRVTFDGPGGHSYGLFGIVNPANALADAVAALGRVPVPESPRTTFNVGMIGGGTSINSIPSSVWMDVDLRSESPDELARLDRAFRDLVVRAVDEENRARSVRLGAVSAVFAGLGERPSGRTPSHAPLVRATSAALRLTGIVPEYAASSTDANLPMSLGVPAIAIDTGIPGGSPHAPDEWIDVGRATAFGALQRTLLVVLSAAGLR
jgi:acetylornithine deacetylase/succinyl-diaminopimelate desuccinylase-like protein